MLCIQACVLGEFYICTIKINIKKALILGLNMLCDYFSTTKSD